MGANTVAGVVHPHPDPTPNLSRALPRWIGWAEWWHFRKVAATRFAAKKARSQAWARSRLCGRALESIAAHATHRQQARRRLLSAAVAHRRRSQAAAVLRWVARRRDVGHGHGLDAVQLEAKTSQIRTTFSTMPKNLYGRSVM